MAARLFDAGSIFNPLYLFSAIALAFIWLRAKGLGARDSFSAIFARDAWLRRSTLVDLAFCLFYLFLLRTAVSSVENSSFQAALGSARGLLDFSLGWTFTAPKVSEGALATIVTMVSIDFASYAVHRLLHRIPLLWKIHRFHHSAERLTPLTTYRQNPLEPLLLYSVRGLAAGFGLALFHKFFPQQTPVILISGMGAGFFLYMFTVNLHHAPVPVRYPRWLAAVAVSPHLHHIHHSADPRHHGANFGVVFSVWDRIFGSLVDEDVEPGELRFGLAAASSKL